MAAGKYQDGHHIVGTVYRVVRHIGTGGMGSLYEVEDTTVGRHYVLKTLHPELIDREDLAVRMQQEARALGRLSHPHIVEVITAGVTGDGYKMPFYVMERLVGHNLRAAIDLRKAAGAGGLGRANAYRIAIDVASALQHAHENAMVHRDVKPENIFLHRGPSSTVTKLLDFGIVRMLNREASLTRGKFLGTLKYSSPEQITGVREMSPSSDVYSLALVVYELLVGRGPFDDLGDAFKVAAAHAGEVPPPPSRFGPVDPAIERLLLQALEKQPEARPASAGVFGAELHRALHELQASSSAATEVDLFATLQPVLAASTTVTKSEPPPGAPPIVATRLSPVAPVAVAPVAVAPVGVAPVAAPTRLEGAGQVGIAPTIAAVPPPTPLMVGAPVHPGLAAKSTMPVPIPSTMPSPGGPATPATPAPPAGIDRDAATRLTPPSEGAIPVARNDTQISAGITGAPAGGAAGAAPFVMGPRIGTLKMPNAPGKVPASSGSKRTQRYISTVQTRPRRGASALIALIAAAVLAAAMIAGAIILVRGRFGH